jgi:hypothetical protein
MNIINFIMNNLEIKIKSFGIIRISLGSLLIVDAILWFVIHYEGIRVFDMAYTICLIFAGVYYISYGAGIETIKAYICDKSIIIKWFNKVKSTEISYLEIEAIYLRRTKVIIDRTGKKSMNLRLDMLEVGQKKEVYDFFISISSEKGINLIKQFDK